MCIIAVSPKNTPIPSADRRAEMFRRNPDGAGIMFAADGRVQIEKGFMSFDAMEKRIAELSEVYDFTALPVVLHYRIGTHGGNTPGNTHPFPITTDRKALKKLVLDTSFAVAHNGIIHSVKPLKGYSDTQEYIVRRLSHIKPPFDRDILAEIAVETGSKFAFLYGNGNLQMTGTFTRDEDDGCYYSNMSYKPRYDFYIERQPQWELVIRRHQSIIPFEPYDRMLPLNDDIVIDENGELHDGADYRMDIYGRIYACDGSGSTTLVPGAHLLLAGAHRSGALDDDAFDNEFDEDFPWA